VQTTVNHYGSPELNEVRHVKPVSSVVETLSYFRVFVTARAAVYFRVRSFTMRQSLRNWWSGAEQELDMDWIRPWIGLDWSGWDDCDPVFN